MKTALTMFVSLLTSLTLAAGELAAIHGKVHQVLSSEKIILVSCEKSDKTRNNNGAPKNATGTVAVRGLNVDELADGDDVHIYAVDAGVTKYRSVDGSESNVRVYEYKRVAPRHGGKQKGAP